LTYLIDTNVWSELRNRSRADSNVRTWAESANPAELYLSVVTVFELERGVLLIARRDAEQGSRLRRWLEERVLEPFDGRILPIDALIARRCAALHVPDPRPERDALIAATALTHGLTVVTRNVGDFQPMGVALLNPWLASGLSIP
jgi:predicted nucleic acid-binding protein